MAEFAHLHTQEVETADPSRSRREAPADHGLLRLQRLAGNAAVSSLLAQRQDDAGAPAAGGAPAPTGDQAPASAQAPSDLPVSAAFSKSMSVVIELDPPGHPSDVRLQQE